MWPNSVSRQTGIQGFFVAEVIATIMHKGLLTINFK